MPAHRKSRRAINLRERKHHQLLTKRRQLGAQWAYRISHALPGAGKLMMELMIIETALIDQWPHLKGHALTQWAIDDAKLLLDPHTAPVAGCEYCQNQAAPTLAATTPNVGRC